MKTGFYTGMTVEGQLWPTRRRRITGMTESDYSSTRFMLSVNRLADLPVDEGVEVAFAGRSNAGKSTAINTITGQRALARTSKTPGRTQMINYFQLGEDGARLVDLPGYGFARVPERIKQHWAALLDDYFRQRQSLRGLVLMMDVRRPLTEFDQQMLNWCSQASLPCHVLLTKADKLSRGAAGGALQKTRHALGQLPGDFSVQLFSGLKRQGVEEARRKLDEWLDPRDAPEFSDGGA